MVDDPGISCPECKSENPVNAVYCMECGCKIKNDGNEGKYKKVQYLAIIGVVFFLPLAIVTGLYLYTRPECNIKRRGMDIILISLVLWILYVVIAIYTSYMLHQ